MCLVGTVPTPRIEHSIPGRVRVHLPRWPGHDADAVERRLRRLPGVRGARANPLTRNVVIRFDRRLTDQAAVLKELCAVEAELTGKPPGETGAAAEPWPAAAQGPLVNALRAVGATLGLGLRKGALPGAQGLAVAVGFVAFLHRFPPTRAALQHLLGPTLTDLLGHLADLVANMLSGDVLGLLLHGLGAVFSLGQALLPTP
jgi:hypothetical protein